MPKRRLFSPLSSGGAVLLMAIAFVVLVRPPPSFASEAIECGGTEMEETEPCGQTPSPQPTHQCEGATDEGCFFAASHMTTGKQPEPGPHGIVRCDEGTASDSAASSSGNDDDDGSSETMGHTCAATDGCNCDKTDERRPPLVSECLPITDADGGSSPPATAPLPDYFRGGGDDDRLSPSRAAPGPDQLPSLWNDKVVPYEIAKDLEQARPVIVQALEYIQGRSCLRFQPRNQNQKDFVLLQSGDRCAADFPGRVGGMQNIVLANGCFLGAYTVVHEMMHILGFRHEHQRPDRDQYVNILLQNVIPDQKDNFEKYSGNGHLGMDTPYDIRSVMQYGSFIASKDDGQSPTMTTKKGEIIKPNMEMTKSDVQRLNKAYKC